MIVSPGEIAYDGTIKSGSAPRRKITTALGRSEGNQKKYFFGNKTRRSEVKRMQLIAAVS
jgi:hypothetical protein